MVYPPLKYMKQTLKLFLPLVVALVSCQNPEVTNDTNTIVIAYLQSSLPGIQVEQNELLNTLNLMNENEGLQLKLIEKVYSSFEGLEYAILNDSSIDIALLPDFLIERYRDNWIPPIMDSEFFTFMPEFEENQAPYFENILARMYRTEEFNPKEKTRYLDTFIPYTFGHYGVAYDQDEYPLRLRRIEDILTYVPIDQLVFESDIRSINYIASLITYREELNQAFELFNTDKINLFQYQSLLSSYLNTSDTQTAGLVSDFKQNQLVNEPSELPYRHVYIGPSHLVSQHLIREDNAYRFEYLRDASLMYFNGFVFLNDLDLENYSLFLDGLFKPEVVNQTIAATHLSVAINHPHLLNQFFTYANAEGLFQTDFTFWFDLAITQSQNVIFNYDRFSKLSTIYPNQYINDLSVIKYNLIQDSFIQAYRENINPNYGITRPSQFNPLFFILIPSPLIIVGFIYFLSKKNPLKKPIKKPEIKAYKLKKALLKAQKKQVAKS